AYLTTAGIAGDRKGPLFRTVDRSDSPTANRMSRNDVLRMIKRRAEMVGFPPAICCHTFRATGITAYLENGGTIENAQAIAAHESPRTTKLYDRTGDSWAAIAWAFSIVPPFSRYAVMPVENAQAIAA